MSRGVSSHVLLAGVLALSACGTTPPARPPADSAAPATEPFKKKPRLNGRGEIRSISLEEFFLLHQSGQCVVFDARPAFFYHLGHVPGAISLPKSSCDEAIHRREVELKAALAEGKTLVVYCTGMMCPDARAVARHLSGFGYPASVFSGGWDAWTEAGMPTENRFHQAP